MFKTRSTQKELMDDFNLSGGELTKNLDEIAIINKYLGGHSVTISGLKKLLKDQNYTHTIVDIGSGGGDGLRNIAQWGRKHGYKFNLIGIDANPFMIQYARERSAHFPEITYQQLEVFSNKFEQLNFDIAICSLFCHHFTNSELVILFKKIILRAKIGMIINDIHRHPLAYYSIKLLTGLFNGSALVQHDAPLSVLRAFTKKDLQDMLQHVGVKYYEVTWKWAFRWQVVVKK